MQSAFVENFYGGPRDELLNEILFTSLMQARLALEECRHLTTTKCGLIRGSVS